MDMVTVGYGLTALLFRPVRTGRGNLQIFCIIPQWVIEFILLINAWNNGECRYRVDRYYPLLLLLSLSLS